MIPLEHDISLKDKTTLKIGGCARLYAAPQSREQIAELLAWAHTQQERLLILGNGSNILVSDSGWQGLVVDTGKYLRTIMWEETYAYCDAGVSLSRLVQQSVERGLQGCERLAGIPGTIGGALVMNAGAFGQEIAGCVDYIDVIELSSQQMSRIPRDQITFGYRTSSLKSSEMLIVAARLRFIPGVAETLHSVYQEILQRRAEKQPLDLPNCGSVFKRPVGLFAGTLIEQSGCKGLRAGDAMVSTKHANFIVNLGKATAEDVRKLVAQVQQRVYRDVGVLLEPEVIFAGEFSTPLFCPQNQSGCNQ